MSTIQTEAFIVHLYDYSETSRIIQFLTAQRGKISCIAKGARRKNNPWNYSLDRLNRVEIFYTLKSTREIQTLTDLHLIDSYPELKKDIKKQVLASLILETAFSMTETEQKAQRTYSQTCKAFEQISNPDLLPEYFAFISCWHLWKILVHNGIEPQLNVCVRCGKPIKDTNYFSFQGGVVCKNCKPDRMLDTNEIQCLNLLQKTNEFQEIAHIKKDLLPLFETRILPFLCSFIIYQLGHPLKSYSVFCELKQPLNKGTNHENKN